MTHIMTHLTFLGSWKHGKKRSYLHAGSHQTPDPEHGHHYCMRCYSLTFLLMRVFLLPVKLWLRMATAVVPLLVSLFSIIVPAHIHFYNLLFFFIWTVLFTKCCDFLSLEKLRSEELLWWVFLFTPPFLFPPIYGTYIIMVINLHIRIFLVEYLKDQFWDPYYLYFMLMILQRRLMFLSSYCLQMTLL